MNRATKKLLNDLVDKGDETAAAIIDNRNPWDGDDYIIVGVGYMVHDGIWPYSWH